MPQYPNWQPPPQERRKGNIYGRSFVIGGVSLIPKRAPDTHKTNRRARGARGDADEAQYCRGARFARKPRHGRMRVLLEITYRDALSDYFVSKIS